MSAMTRLQGVNWVLQRCAHLSAAALDSTGSWPSKAYGRSDEGDAESCLDIASDEAVASGLPSCHVSNVEFSLGSAGTIAMGATAVRAAGKAKLERFNINLIPVGGDMIATKDGNQTFESGNYTFDVWYRRPFEQLPRNEQMIVLEIAARRFMQLKMPDSVDERGLAYDATMASAITPPNIPPVPAYPGMPSIAPPMPQQYRQQ